MAKKEETPVVRFKKSELVKVGEEMNEILACQPPINIGLTATLLEKEIVEAAALVDPADAFSEETWKILGVLGNVFPGAAADAGEDETETGEDETETGEDETETGEDETETGEDETETGEDETETGEDETETGEDETAPKKAAESKKPASTPKKTAAAPAEPKAPRVRKTLWAPGTDLKAVRAGSKLAAALDIMKAKKFKNCSLADLEPLGWNEQLAKAYVCYDINKLGYGCRFNEDGTFDLVLPEGCKMPAHKEK